MPTKNPRISFALSDDLLREIDEFRYQNRIKNQTQAILTLINRGFEAIAGSYTEPQKLNSDELELITEYRSAPNEIKQAVHTILLPYTESQIQDNKQKNRA